MHFSLRSLPVPALSSAVFPVPVGGYGLDKGG